MRLLVLLIALSARRRPRRRCRSDTTTLPPKTEPYEVALLRRIYDDDRPLRGRPAPPRQRHGVPDLRRRPPALWAGTAAAGADAGPGAPADDGPGGRLSASRRRLKNLIQRPRPYIAVAGVTARDRRPPGRRGVRPVFVPLGPHLDGVRDRDVGEPELPRVVRDRAGGGVGHDDGLARVWHGVHYPSDVAVGAALGIATGAGGSRADAGRVRGDEGAVAVPVQIVIRSSCRHV